MLGTVHRHNPYDLTQAGKQCTAFISPKPRGWTSRDFSGACCPYLNFGGRLLRTGYGRWSCSICSRVTLASRHGAFVIACTNWPAASAAFAAMSFSTLQLIQRHRATPYTAGIQCDRL